VLGGIGPDHVIVHRPEAQALNEQRQEILVEDPLPDGGQPVQGRHTGDPVRRAQADGVRGEAGLDEQGTVGVHHAARRPDGARGVDDGRRRLRGDGLADIPVLADQIKRCRQRRISVWEVRREPQLHRSEVVSFKAV
jgi:hypothetical protein